MSYAISSNIITLIISTLVILVLPKILGVEDYGYLQLYLFYCAYVGFLHFGWNDGIYLRYGGAEYFNLNKRLFFSQFLMLTSSQLLIGSLIWLFTGILNASVGYSFIIRMVAISMVIVNIRIMLVYILQITNRIKEYARITIIDRVTYIILVIILLFFGIDNYKVIVFADLIGKLLSLMYSMYCCRDIVFCKMNSFYISISETISNISVGIKLMLANFASLLIIGIVRFGIERNWDITTFGKISLTLSISNLLMVFINAIGIILFPMLRRTSVKNLPKIYLTLRIIITIPMFGLLIFYYPLKLALSAWLPNYVESFTYMALLFPMCVYEGKMALLINTYLKTLRKEKMILIINLATVVLSLLLTLLFTILFKDLLIITLSIVVLLAFRCILAEVLLSKVLNVKIINNIIQEVIMVICFILTAWFLTFWIGFMTYILSYCIYLFIRKSKVIQTVKHVKEISRS